MNSNDARVSTKIAGDSINRAIALTEIAEWSARRVVTTSRLRYEGVSCDMKVQV